jgi:hypothetical protein
MNIQEIRFNFDTLTWEYTEDKQIPLHFGKNNLLLNHNKEHGRTISFKVKENQSRVGPLIGVLVSENQVNSIVGNTQLLKELSREILTINGIIFVFTPLSVEDSKISGYVYDSKLRKWMKLLFPLPDVVYNRIPYRADEIKPETKKIIRWFDQNGIPFFNRHFFNKKNIYHIFSNSHFLKPHIPNTVPFDSFEQLKQFLDKDHHVYLKPCDSLKGEGIWTITKKNDHTYLLQSNETKKIFDNLPSLNKYLQTNSIHEDYLLQQFIQKETVNSRAYDLRVIAHCINDVWHVTGLGIRCAAEGNVTTHVPSGGSILHEEMLPIEIDKVLIRQLVKYCGHELQHHYGSIKEFSLDIGIDKDGEYWIFEANSKPMKFDEPHIKKSVILNLMRAIVSETIFYEISS